METEGFELLGQERYISRQKTASNWAIEKEGERGQLINDALFANLSPLGWEHINLTGDYVWHANNASRKVIFGRYERPRTRFQKLCTDKSVILRDSLVDILRAVPALPMIVDWSTSPAVGRYEGDRVLTQS